jgi:hypothetical protein
MDHFEGPDSAASEGAQGIPAPHPRGKQEGTAPNDTLAKIGKNKGGRPRINFAAKKEARGPDKKPRRRGRRDEGVRQSEDRNVDRYANKDLRNGFELVQRRVLMELKRRTHTLKKLGGMPMDDLSTVFKVCRENIAAIDGQQAPSQEQQVVTAMPFDEEGEK